MASRSRGGSGRLGGAWRRVGSLEEAEEEDECGRLREEEEEEEQEEEGDDDGDGLRLGQDRGMQPGLAGGGVASGCAGRRGGVAWEVDVGGGPQVGYVDGVDGVASG